MTESSNPQAPPTIAEANANGMPKTFRNSSWKAPKNRNKNIKAIIAEEQRRLADKDLGIDDITYFNIDAPPSLIPSKAYCDITGLEGKYRSPSTNLRFYNQEVAQVVRDIPPGVDQQYLELRGANIILR